MKSAQKPRNYPGNSLNIKRRFKEGELTERGKAFIALAVAHAVCSARTALTPIPRRDYLQPNYQMT